MAWRLPFIYNITMNRYPDNASFPVPDTDQAFVHDPLPSDTSCTYMHGDHQPSLLTRNEGHQVCIVNDSPPLVCEEGK